MLKNYLTLGWRNLVRNSGYSFINISGLAMGMTVAILIALWISDELSFNRSFANYDRIAFIQHNLKFNGEVMTHDGTSIPFGNELKSSFPDFEQVVTITPEIDHVISYNDNKFSRKGFFVEPGFVDMFSMRMVEGSNQPFKELKSIAISQSLAKALVGNDPVGKIVRLDSNDDLVITAVFEDFPLNSHFATAQMLMSTDYFATTSDDNKRNMELWGNLMFQSFVLLDENADIDQVSSKIKMVLAEKAGPEIKGLSPEGFVFPMRDWNLRAEFKDGKQSGGKIEFVWMFGTVGAFILLLACINFVNLSTARSEKRSKEIGVRKVMGSKREQLIAQFLSESQLITILSFIASIIIVMLALPSFNTLAEKQITIPWSNPWFISSCIVFIVFTSVVAGSYPALYLSSFNPVKVLKGAMRAGRSNLSLRKALVVFQFTICIAIIGCTIVVFQQIQHSKNRPVGFDREGIFFIQIKTPTLKNADYNLLRNDLLNTAVVENMAVSDFPISGGMSAEATLSWEGKDPGQQPLVALNAVSHDFPVTNGFVFVDGRDFSRDLSSDSLGLVINELAAQLISPGKSAIGTKVSWGKNERHVIGVIKDQIRWGPFAKQSPHIYFVRYTSNNFITVRMNKGVPAREALAKVESVIKKYDPGAPFEYTFVDEDYNKQFKTEERTASLATVFATLAIFISCIGILGLASFAASQRVKEIGVRKILGASIFSIWKMLSKDFVFLVLIAMLIAIPLSRYISSQWLQQYDYRVDIGWWIFIVTGLGALAVTLTTISYQSIKAAMNNPVESLRSE